MKKSNKFEAIKRLTSRYKLIEGQNVPLKVNDEYIQPITNTDELLKSFKVHNETGTMTNTGNKTVATVPAGKRWRIYAINVRSTSGTWTMSSLKLGDTSIGQACTIYQPASSANHFELMNELILDETDTVQVYVDALSVSGDYAASILVAEEDAY